MAVMYAHIQTAGLERDGRMHDQFGRNIDYMRLSITDACDLRCEYCRPRGLCQLNGHSVAQNINADMDELLAYVRAASELGIRHIRLTGGEPLLYPQLDKLLPAFRNVRGIDTISVTTNGTRLKEKAKILAENHIDSVNVSLDTTDRKLYEKVTGFDGLKLVKKGIKEARAYNINIKLNAVLTALTDVLSLVKYADSCQIPVRFIEQMPVGMGQINGIDPYEAVLGALEKIYGRAVPADDSAMGNGPARYYAFDGLDIKVGLIGAIHGRFCDGCNRIRITADGKLLPCLNSSKVIDVHRAYTDGEAALRDAILRGIVQKPKGHHFTEKVRDTKTLRTMDQIGG